MMKREREKKKSFFSNREINAKDLSGSPTELHGAKDEGALGGDGVVGDDVGGVEDDFLEEVGERVPDEDV